MVAGVDLWLNNPMKPLEASGTSGMKANLNGVPSFSVLDGWWVEGHVEGVTGWSIGVPDPAGDPARDVTDLYMKLERVIRGDAVGHLAERQLLQHPAHGAPVRPQRVLPRRHADRSRGPGDGPDLIARVLYESGPCVASRMAPIRPSAETIAVSVRESPRIRRRAMSTNERRQWGLPPSCIRVRHQESVNSES
jgi:hypothetical protein